jgi:hypothetical protein
MQRWQLEKGMVFQYDNGNRRVYMVSHNLENDYAYDEHMKEWVNGDRAARNTPVIIIPVVTEDTLWAAMHGPRQVSETTVLDVIRAGAARHDARQAAPAPAPTVPEKKEEDDTIVRAGLIEFYSKYSHGEAEGMWNRALIWDGI